jgi:hypothetical protein
VADIDERKALIAKLFGAANKHCDETRMEGYLEALKRMDTPRLFRVVEHILAGIEDLPEHEDYKPPTPGGLWKALKRMRAMPPVPSFDLKANEPKFLLFDTNANQLLMAYIWAAHAKKGVMRYAPDSPNPRAPGPITRERTAVLVKWKDAWARDMREDRELYDGKLDGKEFWKDCMTRAEAEIDALIASERAAA